MSGLVLVAEDDELLRSFIAAELSHAGFTVVGVADGADVLAETRQTQFDLIILDRAMTGLDGLSALRILRERGVKTPVMFLTAAGAVTERVRGLDAGADDYMAKPFEGAELVSRARALLRRPQALASDCVEACGVRLDRSSRRVFVDENEIDLTAQDIALLETLITHPGRTFSREALLQRLGGSSDIALTAVEHAISRLRRKLSGAKAGADLIETVRGAGYRLRTPP